MSEMVKRMARAMWLASSPNGPSPDAILTLGQASEVGKPAWMFYEVRVRAALAAMREPTEAMIAAVRKLSGHSLESDYIVEEWRAMIDAAL